MRTNAHVPLLLAMVLVLPAAGCNHDDDPPPDGFVRREGSGLVRTGDPQPFFLRGVNLDNHWIEIVETGEWTLDDDYEGTARPVTDRFVEEDLQRIAALGMNAVRLNMSYLIFEDRDAPYTYKPQGWEFLDRYVEWAKRYGLVLVLSMVVPPGGVQPSGGRGAELWDIQENQDRFRTLWATIADRYRDEPTIAAYDLLNEPTPTASSAQWKQLAQEIVDSIRAVDPNHLVVVEEVAWIVAADGTSPDLGPEELASFQFLVDDRNTAYDFHFYDPIEYTQQLTRPDLPEAGAYPDESVVYTDHEGNVIGRRNKAYLDWLLDERMAFGERNGVPVHIGEFSPNRPTLFEGRGGLVYARDVLDLLIAKNLSFSYYTYTEIYFQQWEIDETPELASIRDELVAIFRGALRP